MRPATRWKFQSFAARPYIPPAPRAPREYVPAPPPPPPPPGLGKIDLSRVRIPEPEPPTLDDYRKQLAEATFELRIRRAARAQMMVKEGDLGHFRAVDLCEWRVERLRYLAWDGTGVRPPHPGLFREWLRKKSQEALRRLCNP